MTRIHSLIAVALMAGLLGGCGSSPTARFYTLSPDATLTGDGAAAPVHVVVSPVTVPEVVDRPQIVTRAAGSRVDIDEFARWAEPLKTDIARVIAADLGMLLGSAQVNVFDSGVGATPAWRVRVDVMRFDSMPGDSVTIDAQWAIRAPGKPDVVMGRSVAHEPVQGQGYDALVTAHDRALGSVSRDIASFIRGNAHK
ncbi:membrane integrity-associated transporter subunit PqiC [Burkholderia stabilis]|uniref:Membrane integrity-associated transporter subunit PqiC n=1 Tax=Burkholderia stabilis TaxID=95485 RepID=A0A4Q2A5H5_9BURK|nr:PqiC family protein [Burkholderia stabilis]RXV64439.1 membrane integrity-associated transporter subunit PqiC [Burkholderia stabilis]